jgi:serine acetyltransferase
MVGAGARVLGRMSLRDNVGVGADSVLLRSLPANSTVARRARTRSFLRIEVPEVLNV